MKIILAPNAFKESLTAHEAAQAMARGFRRALPEAELIQIPIADGGDGTAEVLRRARGGRIEKVKVSGPLGEPVLAQLIHLADSETPTDIIEMAKTSGLALVPPAKRNPMQTTTYGLGEMIAHSMKRGARRILITLGGSATVDGGAGMAQALGFRLLDASQKPIPYGGAGLEKLATILPPDDGGEFLRRCEKLEFIGLCDVENRMLGKKGAAAVFGPQKGATPEMIPRLEAGLKNLAHRIEKDLARSVGLLSRAGVGSGEQTYNFGKIALLPGSGAAGGFKAGLAGFLGASIHPGADRILEIIGFSSALRGADLVVTGEGKLDPQTLGGKGPAAVARAAAALGVPVIGIAGSVDPSLRADALNQGGWAGCFSIVPGPIPLQEAMSRAAEFIETACLHLGRTLVALQK